MATLPFKASVYNHVVPGVPLRSAPGYVLVAPLGRIHPKRVHLWCIHLWCVHLWTRSAQTCRVHLWCVLPKHVAFIRCPYDNVV